MELRLALADWDGDRVDVQIDVRDLDAEELARIEREQYRRHPPPSPLHSKGYSDTWHGLRTGTATAEDELALCHSHEAAGVIRRMRERVKRPPDRSRMVSAQLETVEYDDRLCYGSGDMGRWAPQQVEPPIVRLRYEVWRTGS